MGQGTRPERVAEQIRAELAQLVASGLRDPGIGFVTLTRAHVSPDLQLARIYFTALGEPSVRAASKQALGRAAPYLRRQIGKRLRLKRIPELRFVYDDSIAGQDRIEQILHELHPSHDSDDA